MCKKKNKKNKVAAVWSLKSNFSLGSFIGMLWMCVFVCKTYLFFSY